MRKLLVAALTCWSLLAAGQAAAQLAGKVDLVDGEVRIYDTEKVARTPKVGDPLNQGESVMTGADGELHLAMEDGGQIALRPNTRMLIEKYKADGGADDRSVIGLLQGAMRSVTGWIGKYSPKNYQIRTPTATIGVRGTDHETHVVLPDSQEGEAGTYDKVNIGSTLLRTAQGTTEVRPNQAGFAAHFGSKRPALLSAVPSFFRPGRHESRFADLHERVHQQLEQRRDERIRKVKEKVKEMRTQSDRTRTERKLERRNERTMQGEQRLQQKEERRNSGDAGSRLERRQQLQEKRLQREAGNRWENIGQSLPANAKTAARSDLRETLAERREKRASGQRRELRELDAGERHDRHH